MLKSFSRAGKCYLFVASMLLGLVAATPLQATTTAEQLQLRIGALAEDPRAAGRPVADIWFLTRFYQQRDFTPAWDSEAKLAALLAAVNESDQHGLTPSDYHHTALLELSAATPQSRSLAATIELDLLATDALARLASHLRFGKVDPERLESTWNFDRRPDDMTPAGRIQALLDADNLSTAIAAEAPDVAYYAALQTQLEAYRRLAATGGWPTIAAGETLRPGMRTPRVAALRARLSATGDLPAAPETNATVLPDTEQADSAASDIELFDATLEMGVRTFQARHGLEVDGAVGRQSLAALNVPVEARIDQIRINLERVRWVFHNLEPRFLLVNIARFRVALVENQRIVWSTRAVVGRPYRQTPVFKAQMTYLEFNPTWTVPPTILREDLLPELRADPSALQRRNMRVLDNKGQPVDPASIDWPTVTVRNFPYMIRQEPGPDNALGRVKLMYPNPYHVYMHDTPARSLFARAERSFSSGCIRLEEPLELVERLLSGTEWDSAAIGRVLDSGRTRVVRLPQPISVLTLYGTAVPEGDTVHFAADVYRRDERLLAALNEPNTGSNHRQTQTVQ